MSIRNYVTTTVVAVIAASVCVSVCAGEPLRKPLLNQRFDARPISQVEVGDFHFLPGQLAPLHTHAAPVFGYVSKGAIYYEVEGKAPVLLKTGDAFYEPAGPNIVHFDNASTTEEAVFTDFNFERDGEPFIVFPTPPTARIDRRSFPTARLSKVTANNMSVFETTLLPAGTLASPAPSETVYAYVAEGAVAVIVRGEAPIVYLTGQTFYAPTRSAGNEIANASKTDAARVVTFHLSNTK